MREQENQYSPIAPTQESLLAMSIRTCSPATALNRLNSPYQHWCSWQPGVLFPYGYISFDGSTPRNYHGGLTRNQALFVLVPSELVFARRRSHLLSFAQSHLGTNNQEQLAAYCEQMEKEIVEDMNPRPHPAFHADALTRQVAYWLKLLAYRRESQTVDWSW